MVAAVEATESRTRTRNVAEGPERWRRALDRAVANGIEPLQVAGTGEWVVTSATAVGTVYRADGWTCGCPAGLAGDPVCQHRAVVRFVLGMLPDPESVRPACRVCADKGYVLDPDGRGRPERCLCAAGRRAA